MKKINLLILIFLISLLALTGCLDKKIEPILDTQNETKEITISKSVTLPLTILSVYPKDASTNADIGDYISVTFARNIKADSVNNTNFMLQRVDNGEYLEGRIIVNGSVVQFAPITRFEKLGTDKIVIKGLKQNTQYKVILQASILDSNSQPVLTQNTDWSFTTQYLSYGLYWFGANGECEKYMEGRTNRFYDKSKPVVLYAHGWESTTSSNDYWIEQPYLINDKYSSVDTGVFWRNKGYNTGGFVWGQFSDEDGVTDAEDKIWTGNNGKKNMRYRMKDNSYKDYSTAKGVGELLFDKYKSALADNTSGEIRLVGHSLGNQVVTRLTELAMSGYELGTSPKKLIPSRVALLDPFWSKESKSYLGNIWTGEKCRTIIKNVVSKYGTAVEQYKTSGIGGAVTGDENIDMRKINAFYRVWPDFIPLTEAATQHVYAYVWYFGSMASNISISDGVIGAYSDTNSIKNIMNYGKSSLYYYSGTGNGNKTSTPSDDSFVRKSGVSTW